MANTTRSSSTFTMYPSPLAFRRRGSAISLKIASGSFSFNCMDINILYDLLKEADEILKHLIDFQPLLKNSSLLIKGAGKIVMINKAILDSLKKEFGEYNPDKNIDRFICNCWRRKNISCKKI
jgi:hypothetical protein